MRIACLGWGSLIWDRREFEIRSKWENDGPSVCVEFSRLSSGDRITLVVNINAAPVQVLWAEMVEKTIDAAEAALKKRECPKMKLSCIGTWSVDKDQPVGIVGLSTWAAEHEFDAVIWTKLEPKIESAQDPSNPSLEEVIRTLKTLNLRNQFAREYIEKAPRQIQTAYRRKIEDAFGWVSVADTNT